MEGLNAFEAAYAPLYTLIIQIGALLAAVGALIGIIVNIPRVTRMFRQTIAASRDTAGKVDASTRSTDQLIESVVFLSEQLGDSRHSIDLLASRNDDTFGALARTLTLLEQQHLPDRVRRIEEFMAEAEQLRHATPTLKESL